MSRSLRPTKVTINIHSKPFTWWHAWPTNCICDMRMLNGWTFLPQYLYIFARCGSTQSLLHTGCPTILCAIFLNLTQVFYSLFVNFIAQYPIPLYKRRKMSGQFPLKVQRGLRYLIFHFREEFWKVYICLTHLRWEVN